MSDSLSSAKRTLYLGPIYPPFALLAALGWDRVRDKFPRVKHLEAYGMIVIFFVYIGTYLLFISPLERTESLRPAFEAALSQRTNGPVYLVNPSETIRGASFFYLGKRIPILSARKLRPGWLEDRPGTTLVIESYCNNNQLLSNLLSKRYRLLLRKKFGGKEEVCIYSNGS